MDVVGAHEIAEMLGVSLPRVHQLAADPGFPEPVAQIRAGRIWRRRDIARWAKANSYPRSGK